MAVVTWTEVRDAEARLRADRKHANELIGLLDVIEDGTTSADVRLAAVQACRSLFESWALAGDLELRPAGEAEAGEEEGASGGALVAYRAWLLRAYRRFAAGLRSLLSSPKPPLALRLAALDSLMVLASLEARHARQGHVHTAALDAARGAFRHALDGLVSSRRPPPDELLIRLSEAHLVHLDASYYLLRHVRRLARLQPPHAPPPPERLLAILTLITPPPNDVPPRQASMLAPPAASTPAADASAKKAKAATLASWPAETRRLLARKTHRVAYCRAWRALLALPLPNEVLRGVLRMLPERVFPHVPRPLVYCDLLSDAYARGGAEGVLALRGLFVLMTKHNLEYPHFYRRLYALLTADSLCGPQRAEFAHELKIFLSSSGLPAYLLAAFAKRFARLALVASPAGAALGCALAFNLLLQHPGARVLVHRPVAGSAADADAVNGADIEVAATAASEADDADDADGDDDAALLAAAAACDSYRPDEADPEKCGAINSCLWEVDTLRSHCCPTVASIASLFASPMSQQTPPVDLEPLGTLTYAALGQLETRKRLRSAAVAMRTPAGLFAMPEQAGGKAAKLAAGLDAWRP